MLRRGYQLLVVLAGVACASTGTSSGAAATHDYNRMTAEEVAATGAQNAYEAINKARPQYLKSRGRSTVILDTPMIASVFMDGTLFGPPESLKTIAASQIREIRYYPATDAAIKFGSQYGAGVIDIRSK